MGHFGGGFTPAVAVVLTNIALGSVNSLIKKSLDGGVNHMVVATYRLAISAAFLAPFAYFYERTTRPKLTLSILYQLFFSALLGASLTQFFFLLGLSYTSATLSCAFLSMVPALTFTLALIFRQEKLNVKNRAGLAKGIGILVCILGALFLTFYKGMPLTKLHSQSEASNANINIPKKTHNWVIGCLCVITGLTFFSSWFVVQAKITLKYPCQYSSTVLMSVFGSLQCAVLSLIMSRHVSAWVVTDKFDILVIVYAGVVGQGLSTVAASWCIKKTGPVFTSAFFPVMLISATLCDFALLHKPLYLGSILGSVVAMIGLYVFLWGKNKDMDKKEEPVMKPESQTPAQLELGNQQEDGS